VKKRFEALLTLRRDAVRPTLRLQGAQACILRRNWTNLYHHRRV